MCRRDSCGNMAGIPNSITLTDMRKGTNHTVKTSADLVGNRVMLRDQRGMNQQAIHLGNPLNGKRKTR